MKYILLLLILISSPLVGQDKDSANYNVPFDTAFIKIGLNKREFAEWAKERKIWFDDRIHQNRHDTTKWTHKYYISTLKNGTFEYFFKNGRVNYITIFENDFNDYPAKLSALYNFLNEEKVEGKLLRRYIDKSNRFKITFSDTPKNTGWETKHDYYLVAYSLDYN